MSLAAPTFCICADSWANTQAALQLLVCSTAVKPDQAPPLVFLTVKTHPANHHGANSFIFLSWLLYYKLRDTVAYIQLTLAVDLSRCGGLRYLSRPSEVSLGRDSRVSFILAHSPTPPSSALNIDGNGRLVLYLSATACSGVIHFNIFLLVFALLLYLCGIPAW